MKKMYLAMALSATVCASAFAFNEKSVEMVTRESNVFEIPTYTAVENTNGVMKAKSAVEADGLYLFQWVGRTSSDNSDIQETSVQIDINGSEATIYGLFYNLPVKAAFDASNGTLRVSKQKIADAGEFVQDEEVWCYPMKFDVVDNMISNETEVNYIEFTYYPEGVEMNNGSISYVGGWLAESDYHQFVFNTPSYFGSSSGFKGGWKYMLRFPSIEQIYPGASFEYDESEWYEVGNATLDEGWLRALTGDSLEPYQVPVLKNRNVPTDLLLVNPYGKNTPYGEINDNANGQGFIYLDVANPDCVILRPNVDNGFVSYEYIGYKCLMTSTSVEGMQVYYEGLDIEDILAEAEMYDDEVARFTDDNTVYVPYCRFQFAFDLQNADQWMNSSTKEPIEMYTTITLPEAATGVNTIISDVENAPKRFFNLQGVEIANPAEGELVIVKQGNKASKVIF